MIGDRLIGRLGCIFCTWFKFENYITPLRSRMLYRMFLRGCICTIALSKVKLMSRKVYNFSGISCSCLRDRETEKKEICTLYYDNACVTKLFFVVVVYHRKVYTWSGKKKIVLGLVHGVKMEAPKPCNVLPSTCNSIYQ